MRRHIDAQTPPQLQLQTMLEIQTPISNARQGERDGDAGAHLTQFSGAGDTCYLFEKFVRGRGDMTVERAVQRLTSDLADIWGFTGRGRLEAGKFADLVIFDPATIARGEEEWVDDVPGGSGRYVRHPTGVDRVIVNGETLVADGVYSEAQPGVLL